MNTIYNLIIAQPVLAFIVFRLWSRTQKANALETKYGYDKCPKISNTLFSTILA